MQGREPKREAREVSRIIDKSKKKEAIGRINYFEPLQTVIFATVIPQYLSGEKEKELGLQGEKERQK